MPVQIDPLRGHSGGAHRGFEHGLAFPREGDDGAVVIGIAGAMENKRAVHAGDGCYERVYCFQIVPFGEVRNALDKRAAQFGLTFEAARLSSTILPSRIAQSTLLMPRYAGISR